MLREIHQRKMNQEIAVMNDRARVLSVGPSEARGPERITDKATLLQRARQMNTVLEQEAVATRLAIVENSHTHGQRRLQLVAAVDEERWDALSELGFDTDSTWFFDVMESLVERRPIQLRTLSPTLKIVPDRYAKPVVDPMASLYEQTGVKEELTHLFRKLDPHVRIASMVNDFADPIAAVKYTPPDQDKFVVDTAKYFERHGLIRPDDKPGEDFLFLRASEQVDKVGTLIERLRESGNGSIKDDADGIWFRPHPWLVNSVGELSDPQRKRLITEGILLIDKTEQKPKLDELFLEEESRKSWILFREEYISPKEHAKLCREIFASGRQEGNAQGLFLEHDSPPPTPIALETASFLDPQDTERMNILLMEQSKLSAQQDIYLLLKALGMTGRDRNQPIVFNEQTSRLWPESIMYALTKLFQVETKRLVHALEHYEEFPKMSIEEARQYMHKNYGEEVNNKSENGILPEDETIIRVLLLRLPSLFKNGIDSLAIPGWGPYSYLGPLLAKYLNDGAMFDITDRAGAMVELARQWKEGSLLDKDAAVGSKFERFIVKEGTTWYQGCNDLAREKATIDYGDIYHLPEKQYQVIAESFVSCSISWSKRSFWDAIKAKANALKPGPDSRMIGIHMVGSRSWGTEDRYPSVHLSLDDIKQAYLEAGMEVMEIIPIDTDVKAREGYKGMCIVIARPRVVNDLQ